MYCAIVTSAAVNVRILLLGYYREEACRISRRLFPVGGWGVGTGWPDFDDAKERNLHFTAVPHTTQIFFFFSFFIFSCTKSGYL